MAIQMTGIASGLDTQSMINDLMKVERLKVERVENEKTLAEWKKEEWGEINAKLYSFYKEELFDFKSNATYQQKTLTSSNTSAVAVNNSPGSVQGTHLIEVTQLAKTSNFTTGEIRIGQDPSNDLATSATTMNELFGLGDAESRTLTIGDGTSQEDIVIQGTDTVASLISAIKSKDLDINVNFDANYGRIFMSSKSTGAEAQLSVSGDNNDIVKALGFVNDDVSTSATINAGANAQFSYNNVALESSSNEVSVNGLSLTLLAEGGATSTISVTQDTDAIYDKVKAFVLKYNEIADMMNTKLDADSARGYDPLTDEEKEVMSDKDIELWETKIKDSLLRRDGTLSTLRSDMRNTLTLSQGVTTGSEYKYLSDLGIVTGSYTEKGMLHIEGDEDDSLYAIKDNKLRNAIEEDPEKVMEFLTALGDKLYSNMNERMKSTTLSSSLTFYEDKAIDNKVKEYDERIADLEERLARVEERYYQQFTAMEKAMQQSNSTADWLSQQLAGL
jgi:flagellar hook-associated protein 2